MSRMKLGWYVFLLTGVAGSLCAGPLSAPYKNPAGLVRGAAFIERFLPVPLDGELRSDVWGATNVVPRAVNNGIEDDEYSYWGGNIVKGDDGRFHMFVCRWPEDNVKGGGKVSGHHTWWSSVVVHAVSDSALGPYQFVEEVGKGHNPEIYRLNDGSYIIGVMQYRSFKAPTLNGPWSEIETTFDFLDEVQPQPGVREHDNRTNRTYVPREDGSVLMMNKTGYVFVSKQGNEQFVQVTDRSAYPFLPEPAHLEDPVIWKDEVQYNLIVNDCIGRVALYLRSADGLNWKWEQGVAYDPSIVKHSDGSSENWWKLERPKVLQDEFGRAAFMNFAVIDVRKSNDRANDNHSSKNVVIPMVVPRRLQIMNAEPITVATREIRVKVLAEPGFDPAQDLDLNSLSFGAPDTVNYGKGCALVSAKKSGADLILTFDGSGNGITADHYAAKLLGRTLADGLVFGYATLPE